MRRRRVAPLVLLRCALAAAMLGIAASPSAQQVVEITAIREAVAAPDVQAAQKRFAALAGRGATAELVEELERLAASAAGVSREWLLDQGLQALAALRPTPSARAFAERMSTHAPQLYVRVDPDHGSHAIPVYDPGATARFVLRSWRRAAVRDEVLQSLAAGRWAAIESSMQEVAPSELDPVAAGTADAFRAADSEALARHRGAIIASLQADSRTGELAAIAAERLRDAELYRVVLDRADAHVALKALARIRSVMSEADALSLLDHARTRAEVASASVLELGSLARTNAHARSVLFDLLADTRSGASAAAALASLDEPGVVAALGSTLLSGRSDARRMHAALALKLDGSEAARAELQRFLKVDRRPTRLRKEVSTWLEQ